MFIKKKVPLKTKLLVKKSELSTLKIFKKTRDLTGFKNL